MLTPDGVAWSQVLLGWTFSRVKDGSPLGTQCLAGGGHTNPELFVRRKRQEVGSLVGVGHSLRRGGGVRHDFNETAGAYLLKVNTWD